jgi:hypothetical protein
MASQTQGIQQLLAAEKKAAEKVLNRISVLQCCEECLISPFGFRICLYKINAGLAKAFLLANNYNQYHPCSYLFTLTNIEQCTHLLIVLPCENVPLMLALHRVGS